MGAQGIYSILSIYLGRCSRYLLRGGGGWHCHALSSYIGKCFYCPSPTNPNDKNNTRCWVGWVGGRDGRAHASWVLGSSPRLPPTPLMCVPMGSASEAPHPISGAHPLNRALLFSVQWRVRNAKLVNICTTPKNICTISKNICNNSKILALAQKIFIQAQKYINYPKIYLHQLKIFASAHE